MIDNFSILFFSICLVVTIYRAVKLDREGRSPDEPKK
jgi:hypothetical protein